MLILNITMLILSLAVLYNIYSQRKTNEDIIESNNDILKRIIDNNREGFQSLRLENHGMVTSIKRYLGEELGNHSLAPALPKEKKIRERREHRKKPKQKLSEERRLALSLKAKERWAKLKEKNPKQGRFKKETEKDSESISAN